MVLEYTTASDESAFDSENFIWILLCNKAL